MKWWPKTIIVGVIVLVLLALAFYFYAKPLIAVYVAKTHKHAGLSLRPVPLPNERRALTKGKLFSLYGYAFETPWDTVIQEHKADYAITMGFAEGGMLSVINPARSINTLDIMNESVARDGLDVASIFGTDVATSNYAMDSAVIDLTQAEIGFHFSPKQMMRDSVLLMLKVGRVPSVAHGIFSFQTEHVNGFQFSLPETDQYVVIRAYPNDNANIEISVNVDRSNGKTLSQADLNRIIYSLRLLAQQERD